MSSTAVNSPKPAAHTDANASFARMGIVQKSFFVVKLALFLVTFGFAFPNLLGD